MLEVVGEAGGRWRMLEEAGRNRDLKEAYFQAKIWTSRMEALATRLRRPNFLNIVQNV